MRTVHFRSLTIAAAALFALAGSVAAQDTPSALLNSVEVQQLVARAEPGDHARLRSHFTALADRYTAEAKRHTSMSQGFIGNPSRNLGTGMSAHCKQLANLNTQSATTLRELATYHQTLASGAAATPPPAGARFDAGRGAAAPTDQDLAALAAKASAPTDHRALEAYFLTLAKRYASDATDHAAMATAYERLPRNPGAAASAAHGRLAKLSQAAAKEANEAAAMHKQQAGGSR
jgi:hypothetical protein